jgi:cytochrome oxidase Cu insertion factor (SCO1/SenC/PrrC family)
MKVFRSVLVAVAALLFSLCTAASTQQPQPGPVDGEGLPATEIDRVRIGQIAPDFQLVDERGTIHQLSQYRGKKNVVLVVYRGYW